VPLDITEPTSGQTNWDIPLNAALTQVDIDATNALTNIANHSSNIPSDPHGDRAYASGLVTPITSGTNLANGYVKLDGSGHIPANLISGTAAGGMYTNVYDAVGLYGMTPGTSTDSSTQLQNALNAANNAGGGLVWIGAGTFSLANYVVIGNNTWLLLSEGTVLQRIQGMTNPPYLISNVQFGTTNTPSTGFKISGGKLDAVGSQNLTSACTPIFIIQATKVEVRDIWINSVYNNPAIELNGVNVARLDWLHFTGAGSNASAPTVPAIRLNTSTTGTTPAGLAVSLYNNSICQTVKITDSETGPIGGTTYGTYGSFCASDLTSSFKSKDITVTACSTRYNSSNFTPVNTSQWQNWNIDNCNFNETNSNTSGSAWQNMTLKNGFSVGAAAGNANYTPAYRMMQDGTLAIRGALNTPNNPSGTIFATLPLAFANTQPFNPGCVAIQSNGNNSGYVYIDSSGNLTLTAGSGIGNNYNILIDGLLRI
jgi:hypothetical protein